MESLEDKSRRKEQSTKSSQKLFAFESVPHCVCKVRIVLNIRVYQLSINICVFLGKYYVRMFQSIYRDKLLFSQTIICRLFATATRALRRKVKAKQKYKFCENVQRTY